MPPAEIAAMTKSAPMSEARWFCVLSMRRSAPSFSMSIWQSRAMISSRCASISISVIVLPRSAWELTKRRISWGTKVLLPPPIMVIFRILTSPCMIVHALL